MIRLCLVLSILLAGIAAAGGAMAASLRDEVSIEGEEIRLGDVFDGLSAHQAAVAIARAPGLGRQIVLDATWASRVARAYGVDYRPDSPYEQITIIRVGHLIPAAVVEEEVAKLVRDRLPEGRIDMQFDAPADLHVPAEMAPTVSIQDFRLEPNSGRFTATIRAPATGDVYLRHTVSGRAESLVQVPVLADRLRSGAVIGPSDLAWIELPSSRVPLDVATSEDDLVGMSPRRVLGSDVPVRLGDLRPPVVVGRGQRVTMNVRYGVLSVTATGRSLEDGAMGQFIRVVNIDSNRTVEALVTGPNQVAVDPAGMPTDAN